MKAKANQLSASELFHVDQLDFCKYTWDSCPCFAQQLLPWLQTLFDAAGIIYILYLTEANQPRIPYLERPNLAYDIMKKIVLNKMLLQL